MTETEMQSLRIVLADLTFPAQRWEIITQADWYGADAVTTHWLRQLPSRAQPYRDIRDLMRALNDIAA
ncbi:MAG TPA: hypothetical protein VHV74_16895 [Pseudonocardiaceae bacterium]|jgi:hypothetical protein|nr:hypothetical protein [Pseudonocardiaceae bacterium]